MHLFNFFKTLVSPVEWKTKPDRGPRNFTKQNFPGIFVEGPLQENFCDCGVFLLQFVEKFFEVSSLQDLDVRNINLICFHLVIVRFSSYCRTSYGSSTQHFQSPITDYRFPVERKDWFSQQDITKKRESLRKLIVRLGPNRQFTDATNKR